jgi:dienelactone hydrolase
MLLMQETTIAGLDAYISRPSSGPVKSAIVLVSDVFGWKANNARLFADKVASEGVCLPAAARCCRELYVEF